jgi:hypothetical protein
MIKLGNHVKDSITGFAGVATARTEHLYGCVQICVEPAGLEPDGKLIKSEWFDEQRLGIKGAVDRVGEYGLRS